MVEEAEKILKALADGSRLRILNMLSRRSLCVCEITALTGLSQSTVSGHLKVLRDAGLATDNKDGLWVEYRLAEGDTFARKTLDAVLAFLAADPQMTAEKEAAFAVSREMICRR